MKEHSFYVGRLKASEKVENEFFEALKACGYNVKRTEKSITPTKEERFEYQDAGDILITQRLEIKHWLSIDFKCLEDISYDEIMIDEDYKVEKKHESSLFAYFIINKSLTHYIFIPATSREYWYKATKFDRALEENRTWYFIKKDKVKVYAWPKSQKEEQDGL